MPLGHRDFLCLCDMNRMFADVGNVDTVFCFTYSLKVNSTKCKKW